MVLVPSVPVTCATKAEGERKVYAGILECHQHCQHECPGWFLGGPACCQHILLPLTLTLLSQDDYGTATEARDSVCEREADRVPDIEVVQTDAVYLQ